MSWSFRCVANTDPPLWSPFNPWSQNLRQDGISAWRQGKAVAPSIPFLWNVLGFPVLRGPPDGPMVEPGHCYCTGHPGQEPGRGGRVGLYLELLFHLQGLAWAIDLAAICLVLPRPVLFCCGQWLVPGISSFSQLLHLCWVILMYSKNFKIYVPHFEHLPQNFVGEVAPHNNYSCTNLHGTVVGLFSCSQRHTSDGL